MVGFLCFLINIYIDMGKGKGGQKVLAGFVCLFKGINNYLKVLVPPNIKTRTRQRDY